MTARTAATREETVLVMGGTGFLGRHIAIRLRDDGYNVRIGARQPPKLERPQALGESDRTTFVQADLRDHASLTAALSGTRAVVNAVALYSERKSETFHTIHVEGARRLAMLASDAGVRAFVLISGIGADPASPSRYVRARAEGEAVTRQAFSDAIVLRPSVLFGAGDNFVNSLARLLRLLPVFPLFGDGTTKLQPVHVEDVALAAAKALELGRDAPRIYELGGAQVLSYREILRSIAQQAGGRPALLPLPYALWGLLADLMRPLPAPPVTRHQIALMRHDNVADPAGPGFQELGIAPAAFQERLSACLRQAEL